MQADFRRVRIFVASPSDVQSEREQLAKVINELNLTITAIAPEKRVLLELVRWETHVSPSLGRDPQDVVNRQIGEYDLFVGILWKRMGTPTAVATSGTEEEFNRAYNCGSRTGRFPCCFTSVSSHFRYRGSETKSISSVRSSISGPKCPRWDSSPITSIIASLQM